MRGECNAALFEAGDGRYYVSKALSNPHGPRALINEYVAHSLMVLMGLPTPDAAFVRLPQQIAPTPIRHWASMYPGHPNSTAVYDFLPERILSRVVNRDAFFGALVFDQWVSNAQRQAIFFRCSAQSSSPDWRVSFIDNEAAFERRAWSFANSPGYGVYPRRQVYGVNVNMADLAPWIERVQAIDRRKVTDALQFVPSEWLQPGDTEELADLVSRLWFRRNRLDDLLARTVRHLQTSRESRLVELSPKVISGDSLLEQTDPLAYAG
jgi:hypothetical protein